MDNPFLWVSLLWTILAIDSYRLYKRYRDNKKTREHKNDRAQEEKQAKRDQQLRHGRKVFDWLQKEVEQYEKDGIRIKALENDIGKFTILVHLFYNASEGGHDDILRISYYFVGYPQPYQGHLFYGEFGPDTLIWTGNKDPYVGLDRLVLKEIENAVAQKRGIPIGRVERVS